MSETFNPKKHICKFGFELYDYATNDSQRHNILCDLYQKEIVFEFINKQTDEVEEVIGYRLSDLDIKELLQLIRWDCYEKYRDLPDGWKFEFKNGYDGYRDGWGYKFWCLSESGLPLFQACLDVCFVEDKVPPYEKLLLWIKKKYAYTEELKNKFMLW